MASLIERVPFELDQATANNTTPCLPVNPLSYRKTWQIDDEGYNFIHDYLSSMTEYDFDADLKQLLDNARNIVASRYSVEQLYEILIETGPDTVKRRHETKALKEIFEQRVSTWNTKNKSEVGKEEDLEI